MTIAERTHIQQEIVSLTAIITTAIDLRNMLAEQLAQANDADEEKRIVKERKALYEQAKNSV